MAATEEETPCLDPGTRVGHPRYSQESQRHFWLYKQTSESEPSAENVVRHTVRRTALAPHPTNLALLVVHLLVSVSISPQVFERAWAKVMAEGRQAQLGCEGDSKKDIVEIVAR